ncbi:hypothetical protein [Pelosinus propionicus]|uniref:Uncharacterized protein n=1 Tax=Pelosinus propionicus DSM 13327 TaxID=1123291 RepID=A0A1I4PKV2_9FIRM|nr:hypothetical protein [Pelosinus propionicus]SFM28367.1 hypothetical protein SAMN04490355_106616 [Pelosinus propionicus DSM 13327]
MLYEIHNKRAIDSNKSNIILFVLENPLKENLYLVTYQYILNVAKILSQDFNIIIVPKNSGSAYLKHYVDHPEYGKYAYIEFDKNGSYRASTAETMPLPQKIQYFNDTFSEMQRNDAWLFDKLAGTLGSHFIIPGLNINYESTSDDLKDIKKRDIAVNRYIEGMKYNKLIQHNAFIQHALGFPVEFLIWLMKEYDVWHYGFCHDTGSAWLQHTSLNPFTKKVVSYFFVNDNKGVREFKKFPMEALQDCYGKQMPDKSYYDNILENKPYDLMWGGNFPFELEHRRESWYKYFHQLNANAIIRTKPNGQAVTNKNGAIPKKWANNALIQQFITDINGNRYIQPTLAYDQYNESLKDALFTLALRCYYGKHDNLGFRIGNALFFGTVPLISDEYDKRRLYLPKRFREILVVTNNQDIEEKIKYFRNDPEAYKDLFWELFNNYFDKRDFYLNYYHSDFKREYFSGLYEFCK